MESPRSAICESCEIWYLGCGNFSTREMSMAGIHKARLRRYLAAKLALPPEREWLAWVSWTKFETDSIRLLNLEVVFILSITKFFQHEIIGDRASFLRLEVVRNVGCNVFCVSPLDSENQLGRVSPFPWSCWKRVLRVTKQKENLQVKNSQWWDKHLILSVVPAHHTLHGQASIHWESIFSHVQWSPHWGSLWTTWSSTKRAGGTRISTNSHQSVICFSVMLVIDPWPRCNMRKYRGTEWYQEHVLAARLPLSFKGQKFVQTNWQQETE